MISVLAIDQGTTSSRAILFGENGQQLYIAQREIAVHCPREGWVEQDAVELLSATKATIADALRWAADENLNVVAAGMTNQRETTVVWDKQSGQPIYSAIVWQDSRTADTCLSLKSKVSTTLIERTGLLLDPYFSATKIAWILDNVEGAREKAEQGGLLFGTVDTFLLWNLTQGQQHLTDATNASRTLLFDIKANIWSQELLALFEIPRSMLPDVRDSVDDFGSLSLEKLGELGAGLDFENYTNITVKAVLGDQQAALVGQACFDEGDVKSTFGTGAFMLMNTGSKLINSDRGLLSTVAYRVNGVSVYALEGAVFVAGSLVQWLRDGLAIIETASETESLALAVDDNGGVYFVPALVGLGAPYWQPDATGLITGINRGTKKEHIVRAALEAQAFQTRDLISAMESDSGFELSQVRADGGLVANRFFCQALADQLGVKINLPEVTEATAWGAAAMALLGAGYFNSLNDIASSWKSANSFQPVASSERVEREYEQWQKAIKRVLL